MTPDLHLDDRSAAELGPNQFLIGCADARSRLNTPTLVLDLDALEANIATLADFTRAANVHLRPHAKCHKSVAIARRQFAAGAIGMCCATIGEAEVLSRAGIPGILVTSPLTTAQKIARFLRLARTGGDAPIAVVDHPANVAQLAEAARAQGLRLRVLVDIDPGMHRTGVATADACMQLVADCAHRPELCYEGVQCYAGLGQHIVGLAARREYAEGMLARLRGICDGLRAAGHAPAIVSGSGTGAFALDAGAGLLTELQCGSYLFMDNQYCQLEYAGDQPRFARSLFVQAAVVSANHAGFVTVDAGLKHFAVDGGAPVVTRGAPPNAVFAYMGDEHGRLDLGAGAARPAPGSRIEFGVPHCDPTVNLYNHYHCFRGEMLVDIWPVDARGS